MSHGSMFSNELSQENFKSFFDDAHHWRKQFVNRLKLHFFLIFHYKFKRQRVITVWLGQQNIRMKYVAINMLIISITVRTLASPCDHRSFMKLNRPYLSSSSVVNDNVFIVSLEPNVLVETIMNIIRGRYFTSDVWQSDKVDHVFYGKIQVMNM